ncbi:MAG: hypothetical protein AAF290_06800 [Pseudomonadota bacterium]
MSIDYGIEWAYGEFRIAKLRGSEVVESWKSPTPVTDLDSLTAAMYEAGHHVDISRGGSVAIAYEDDLHTHEFLEVPPLSKRDLNKYLQRHVERYKPFPGPAAWRAHPVDRSGISGVLLHLMPKEILDAVMRICEELYLLPKLLVPLTEIMGEFVPSLDTEPDHALLIIALFDDRTQMLISGDHGETLFVRELSYPWTPENTGRLILDINRTLGYAKQRIGGAIKESWFVGEKAEETGNALMGAIDADIRIDPRSADPQFWMREVAGLPLGLASNFIPVLARRSISAKTLIRSGMLMTATAVVLSLFFSAMVEFTILQHKFDEQYLRDRIAQRNAELETLRQEVQRMDSEADKLDILNVDAFNLPAIFLSHLGDVVPDGLVLTEAAVSNDSEAWTLRLAGRSVVPLGELAPLLMDLEQRLVGEPWNAEITTSWRDAWMQQLRQGKATQDGDVGFEIVGRLK